MEAKNKIWIYLSNKRFAPIKYQTDSKLLTIILISTCKTKLNGKSKLSMRTQLQLMTKKQNGISSINNIWLCRWLKDQDLLLASNTLCQKSIKLSKTFWLFRTNMSIQSSRAIVIKLWLALFKLQANKILKIMESSAFMARWVRSRSKVWCLQSKLNPKRALDRKRKLHLKLTSTESKSMTLSEVRLMIMTTFSSCSLKLISLNSIHLLNLIMWLPKLIVVIILGKPTLACSRNHTKTIIAPMSDLWLRNRNLVKVQNSKKL